MVPSIKFLAIAITATLLVPIVLGSQYEFINKKTYVRTGQEAVLSGTVRFTGEQLAGKRIDMSADPVCQQSNPDPRDEGMVVSTDKLANVLVYATSATLLENYRFDPPSEHAVLEHKDCRYEPRVMGIQTGQPLMVMNSDATQHNTHPIPKSNVEWNMSQAMGAPPIIKTFDRAEVSIPFRDNQHPWEKAYVGVFSHPFFAVTGRDGNYKIEGLPAGSYKIIAWHEKFGEKTVDVVFVPGESRNLGFNFDAADLKD